MKRSASIYIRLLSVQIRSQMVYRVSFWFEMAAMAITMFMFFGSLALIFNRFGNLGGWSLGEVAFLWGLVEFSFGSMDMIFSGFDPQVFGRLVRLGTFDQMLLRPVNVTIQVLGSKFLLRRLARMAEGALIFTLALWMVEIEWTLFKLLYLPLVIFGMICFFGGLFVTGATISFWTIESLEAMNIFTYGGSEMIAYPMHIYPAWLRNTFTYVIPAIFLNYYPALYFLDKSDPVASGALIYFLSPLIGMLVLFASVLFWRFGINHYQSTGS